MTRLRTKLVAQNVVDKSDGFPSPFIGLESIDGGLGRLSVSDLPTKRAEDSLRHRQGDVLFSKLRPYLAKSILARESGTGTGELLVLRPSEQIDPRYLFYNTLSRPWLDWAEMTSYGSKMPRTSWEAVGDFPLWLPSVEEQRRIADFLDVETARIDNLSTLVRQALLLLEERRTLNVLRCVQPVVDGRMRTVPLKRLASSVTVGIVVTPAKWYVDGEGVTALRGLNVRPGAIDLSDTVKISDEGHALHAKSRLRAGDVVVVRTGKAGVAAVVPDSLNGANCIDLVIVRPTSGVNPKFLEIILNSEFARQYINESSVGTIQSHLNVAAMKQLPIPRVDSVEQAAAVREVAEIDAKMELARVSMQRQIELLAERRQALITAAVTGQFDVTTGRGADLS
ncbi:hypothetical protein [Micromonospora sp. NPDC005979]|uniref:hypothetical protein n=1 Tax=Micromonospora sp. NPDC005979 TaxID=3156726 RepID=UPI0033ADBA9D